jgi:glycosyltransferase involved in cell wall biosynthesis
VLQDVGEYLQQADRFYMHDGEFLFPYAYRRVPTVVSLRDNVYPETLLGGFLFRGDKLILISEYARLYFEQTVGRFFPELHNRIEVIHNGIDWNKFKPTSPDELLDVIPVNPATDVIILHPHRPEETKGIWQTIAVVDRLVHQYGIERVRTLVPRWLDLGLSDDLHKFYGSIEAEIARRGLTENFIFHDWMTQNQMPAYYSLGSVTLALGNFVESFGNTVYESLGCGTPVVVSRISSHRELLPENLIDKVDFNDNDTAARLAANIIREKRRTPAETVTYLHHHYSTKRQLERYADVILCAKPAEELEYRLRRIDDTTCFSLPVWCYRASSGIYHDFRASYQAMPTLTDLLERWPNGFTFREAAAQGISQEQVIAWYRDGYLYPA